MDAIFIFIRYVGSVAALLGAGFALLIFFEHMLRAPKEGFLNAGQKYSLSFLIGSGCISIYLFVGGLFKMPYNFLMFVPFFAISFALGFWAWKRRSRAAHFKDVLQETDSGAAAARGEVGALSKIHTFALGAMGALMVFHVAFVVFQSGFIPTYFDDAVHTWNLRAKLLFEHGALFIDKTSPVFGGTVDSGFQMTSYPLASTLIKIYLAVSAGGFFEPVINSSGLLVMLSVAGFLFFTVFQYSRNYLISAVVPYLIISLPLGEIHVASGYVDFLFGLIASLAVAMLFLWLERERKIFYLAASVFLLGLAGLTKTNPFTLFIIPFIVTVLFASLRSVKQVLIALVSMIAGFGLLLGPWFVFKGIYPWQIAGFLKFENHIDAFPLLFTVLFSEGNYNIFFFAFVLFLLILVFKRFSTPHLALIGFILLTMFLLFASFLFSQYGAYLEDQTTFNRAMLALLPSLIFVVSIVVYDWMKVRSIPLALISAKNKRKGKM